MIKLYRPEFYIYNINICIFNINNFVILESSIKLFGKVTSSIPVFAVIQFFQENIYCPTKKVDVWSVEITM